MGRCHGWCCREIRLPLSPDDLAQWAQAERDGAVHQLADAIYLEDMLVPVTEEEAGRWLYLCRHLLPNGDCDDYANRPAMCRDYPYGRPCRYPQCEAEEGRRGDGV